MQEIEIVLKKAKEKPVHGRHPWIFSGAIDLVDENYKPGDIVRVYSSRREFLGKGTLNPRSEIAVRMLTFEDEAIDEEFFQHRLRHALALRMEWLPPATNAYRVVNSEGDFLPGLIVDCYGPYLVVQVLTIGMERLKPWWLKPLGELLQVRGIFEKDESEPRRREGLEDCLKVLVGEEPPDYVEIEEQGVKFIVDVKHGQKTGFFLDQRGNRKRVREMSARRRVLNAFSYTGAFSVASVLGGAARVTSVEASETALNMGRHHFEINGADPSRHDFVRADVFDYLRKTSGVYDLIILDPPAFAKAKNQVNGACRGYKDINLQALKKLAPSGYLVTFSCSSYISQDLFQKVVFAAAKDARRDVQMVQKTAHGADHPVSLYHPEGEYLKGMWCRVS